MDTAVDGNRVHGSRRSFGRGNHGIPGAKGEKGSQLRSELRSELRKALRGKKAPWERSPEHLGEQDTGRERMDGQGEGKGFRAMKKKFPSMGQENQLCF